MEIVDLQAEGPEGPPLAVRELADGLAFWDSRRGWGKTLATLTTRNGLMKTLMDGSRRNGGGRFSDGSIGGKPPEAGMTARS
jgi:hypothetical protein